MIGRSCTVYRVYGSLLVYLRNPNWSTYYPPPTFNLLRDNGAGPGHQLTLDRKAYLLHIWLWVNYPHIADVTRSTSDDFPRLSFPRSSECDGHRSVTTVSLFHRTSAGLQIVHQTQITVRSAPATIGRTRDLDYTAIVTCRLV